MLVLIRVFVSMKGTYGIGQPSAGAKGKGAGGVTVPRCHAQEREGGGVLLPTQELESVGHRC